MPIFHGTLFTTHELLDPSAFPGAKLIRKILVSVKFVSVILGPEMGAPILWTPGKMRSFCRKNRVRKIPRFFGGVFWGGGGGVPILFLWARGFFWIEIGYTRTVPEVQGDEIFLKWSEKRGRFLVANLLSIFPRKKRPKICHRKLHHILHCKKINLSPGTHSGSILAQNRG